MRRRCGQYGCCVRGPRKRIAPGLSCVAALRVLGAYPTRGTLPELAEVVALGRAGAVRAETECLTLGQAADAYRRLRRGEVRGRAVVTPGAG
jgi:D-arabinose 1-dehydrogenase-like Zn-dependent alcohol dehydrogenase